MPMLHAGKVVLAPMVRVGTLPTRLLALEHGADLVYGEELVDYKFMHCQRVENQTLGTIDFVSKDNKVLFRTCPRERDRVVFQIGTADPERALRVAQLVQNDVAAIDVNMGCPKSFSLQGGMGAALLRQPERAVAILDALVRGVHRPVTCKIRLLETLEETLALVRALTATGIAAIGVHARFTAERPRDPPHYDMLAEVVKASPVPVIANGASADIATYDDMIRLRERVGASSIMVARAAEWNPSVFRRAGPLPLDDVIRRYLQLSVEYDNYFENSKYVVTQMMRDGVSTPEGDRVLRAQTMAELCDLWGLRTLVEATEARRARAAAPTVQRISLDPGSNVDGRAKRQKTVLEMDVRLNARFLAKGDSPKAILHRLLDTKHVVPQYDTVEDKDTRYFKCELTVDGETFTTAAWQRSKKLAEQASATAYLLAKAVAVDIPALETHARPVLPADAGGASSAGGTSVSA